MKFTLTYDGELRSNGRPTTKWEIRKQFHPQLKELWKISPALRYVEANRIVPGNSSFAPLESHHSIPEKPPYRSALPSDIDLCASILVGDRTFCPLVRNTFATKCSLKIVFLRKEDPGRVYQGGDLDNRLKTLFDALSVPNSDQTIQDDLDEPIHCLLEDDSLITGCTIETHRLLSRPEVSKHHVHLLVEVDVRVSQSRLYNQAFLGD